MKNSWQKIQLVIRQYFDFSQKETNGFIVLMFLMMLMLILPIAFDRFYPDAKGNTARDQQILDSIIALIPPDTFTYKDKKSDYQLGYTKKYPQPLVFKTKEVTKTKYTFDINTADTNQLEKIYGIGYKLAARIVKYRNKLGGFVHLQQLQEVWGLDSTVIDELKKHATIDQNFQPVKININSADYEMLKNHPYIGYKFAKVILAYASQHGGIHSIDQLKEIKILTDSDIEKMKPYLAF